MVRNPYNPCKHSIDENKHSKSAHSNEELIIFRNTLERVPSLIQEVILAIKFDNNRKDCMYDYQSNERQHPAGH